jgi:hypothetical protein
MEITELHPLTNDARAYVHAGSRIPATRAALQETTGKYDPFLWIIVAVFAAWELLAHFLWHNVDGHTLSNRIWAFEKLTGWKGRAIVGTVVVVLFTHLVFMVP